MASIRPLPIAEQWDCTGCGKCCRGNSVPLDAADLARLRGQQWDQHADFQGIRTVFREGFWSRRYRLAQRYDGTCVFLSDQGRCRIHEEFGFDAKPLVCRMYPLQLVPVDGEVHLTLRRSCPTAAADRGRPLEQHRRDALRYADERPRLLAAARVPAVVRGDRGDWPQFQAAAGALESLLTDERFPLVRRLVHGLRFCATLGKCRLRRLDQSQYGELMTILSADSQREAAALFAERQPPGRAAAMLFRQVAAEYLRLHPVYLARPAWWSRWRLFAAAMAFARGSGEVPKLHPDFPAARFDALEALELGHWEDSAQRPLRRYFETTACSRQYAVVSRPGWTLMEKYRATVLAYPVALWILRYLHGDRSPSEADVIDLVTAIDRGQGYAPLTGRRHRHRVSQLAELGDLDRLVAWYAR